MPDEWEQANGTSIFIADAEDDPDGDGLTNWEEYLAGTLPNEASSVLRVENISSAPNSITFEFLAVSNRTYRILFSPSMKSGSWTELGTIDGQSITRWVTITNAVSSSPGFYRVTTP